MKRGDYYYSTWAFLTVTTMSVILAIIVMWVDVGEIFISITLKTIVSLILVMFLIFVIEVVNSSNDSTKRLNQIKIDNYKRLYEPNNQNVEVH